MCLTKTIIAKSVSKSLSRKWHLFEEGEARRRTLFLQIRNFAHTSYEISVPSILYHL